jgi:hypothetical protein
VVYVMPYSVSQLHQAERIKTDAERRQADIERGERAAEMARLWQDLRRPLGALRRYRARRHPAARYAASI